MTNEEISKILKLHKAWINGEKHGKRACLFGANLSEANLSGACLFGANLSEADLSRAENVPYTPMACPDEGEFTGWKKCKSDRIVKLKIPENARRSSASQRKCRCDKAEVIEITSIDGKEKYTEAVSDRDADFIYKVGEMVSVDDFCENRWEECTAGIHFFMNRKEAVDYWL